MGIIRRSTCRYQYHLCLCCASWQLVARSSTLGPQPVRAAWREPCHARSASQQLQLKISVSRVDRHGAYIYSLHEYRRTALRARRSISMMRGGAGRGGRIRLAEMSIFVHVVGATTRRIAREPHIGKSAPNVVLKMMWSFAKGTKFQYRSRESREKLDSFLYLKVCK
jgi:hypothetical protein